MFKFIEKKWSEVPINRKRKNPEIFTENFKKNDQPNKSFDPLGHIYDIQQLVQYVQNFDGCQIKKQTKNTVVCCGPANADLMIIGEAPGEAEDNIGAPFVGDSGVLLKNLTSQVGLVFEDSFVTNCVFWRPPNNRKPTQDEIFLCRPMILKQISLVNPKIILLLGSVALNMLFNEQQPITKIRGTKLIFEGKTVVATFHPSYILHMPRQKQIVLEDLGLVKTLLSS